MGRAPCCDKTNVKKGPWSPEEDAKLKEFIEKHGTGGNWIALPQKAGLRRCGKSCRLRWLNYLRPNIKHGEFSDDEDRIICNLYANIGSRWSIIAAQLPGRTDNDIKNYWNTKLKKKLMRLLNPTSQIGPQHQATSFSSLLQATALSPSTQLSSSYSYRRSNHIYYGLSGPVNDPTSFSSSPLSNSSFTSNSVLQPEESFVSPMQHNYQVKESLLMVGGEASCSSSDGSWNNQINHVKETEYGYIASNSEQSGLQNYLHTGIEEDHKLLLPSGGAEEWSHEKQNGFWVDNPSDYGFEEIKQLISTSSCNNFLFDDNKTEEKIMYY
ncbi:hypothetical protein K2173_001925 [Erythroxylum novogranatense]|uniref:Uncharacterized protein n=1 Tax=Erythroxylum novogranatense TaxID=1862640 RepID=A0AAV8SNZ7_9ROSI|nr:hypothetical protein K2173_001925 [Erythroxylum novogranatense]